MRTFVAYNLMNGGVGRADPIAEVLEAQHADAIVLFESDNAGVLQRIAGRLKMDFFVGSAGEHSVAILSRHTIAVSIDHAAIANIPAAMMSVELRDARGDTFTLIAMDSNAGPSLAEAAFRSPGRTAIAFLDARSAASPELLASIKRVGLRECSIAIESQNSEALPPRSVGHAFVPASLRDVHCRIETDRLAQYASDSLPLVLQLNGGR